MEPMNIHTLNAATVLLLAALLNTSPAHAATQTYSFAGALDSGAFVGETFDGTFSFDDAALTGVGDEYAAADSLSLNFHGRAFTLADAAAATEAAFSDGVFLGLGVAIELSDPGFALIPGVFDASDAYIAYQPSLGTAGFGSVAYTLAAVPEADTYAMMLAGLGLLGIVALRRISRPTTDIF
jgi:PEP-CTERM motif.